MDPTIGTDALAGVDGPLGYALVFLLAAIPVVEVLVVVPAGVALGMNPALVALAAFAGNLTTVLLVIVGSDRALAFVQRRFGDPDDEPSKRVRRAKRLWKKYGTPGLALAAPISTGAHLAAVLALSLGSGRRDVASWMAGSLLVWTAALAAASFYGVESLGAIV
ncbi:MAG TPA: small multi-drug export protein [Natronoarchaeum rubrum]|nr:small multi-drug export protein [Natronoarchaeum rubrum]